MLTPLATSGVSSSCIAPGTLRVDRTSEVLSLPDGALGLRQAAREPLLALRQALGMRVDPLYARELPAAAHQALADRQHDFAADLRRRGQEQVERAPDRALGRVLHRHHAATRRAG